MDGISSWKVKQDKYEDEDEDEEIKSPKLNGISKVKFIKKDSVNKKAMDAMRIKW